MILRITMKQRPRPGNFPSFGTILGSIWLLKPLMFPGPSEFLYKSYAIDDENQQVVHNAATRAPAWIKNSDSPGHASPARTQARQAPGDSSHFFFFSLHRAQPVNDFDTRPGCALVEDILRK